MHRGFTKLFNTIVTSTIWQEDDKTRIVWITMLAIADAFGNVFAAIPGLASVANVSIEAASKAIENLKAPDSYSRTKDFEGRRIEEIDGGWHILNYDKYRRMMNEEERKEYKAKWIAEKRKRVDKSRQPSTPRRPKSTLSTQADAEASSSKEEVSANGSRPQSVEDWLRELEADKTYAGIDVRREYGKMLNWCKIRKKQPTKRRFVNWLNNTDKPLPSTHAARVDYKRNHAPPTREPSEEELAQHRAKVRELSAKLRDELKK